MPLIALILSLLISLPLHAEITGKAKVLNGDTFQLGETTIRLSKIDAPELEQKCRTHKGRVQKCGRMAAQNLLRIVQGQPLNCHPEGQAEDGVTLATCYLGPFNINEQMIADGWAVALPGEGNYIRAENFAKARNEGMWRSTFVLPWEWRAGRRLEAP